MKLFSRPRFDRSHIPAVGVAMSALLWASLAAASAAILGSAASATPAQSFQDCSDCPTMIVIPAGRFLMGSSGSERTQEGVPKAFADREAPQHEVTIARRFALSRNEITRGQYSQFVAATKRPDPESCGVYDAKSDSWVPRRGFSWRKTGFRQTDTHPAACVSWSDAHDYAEWLAQRTGQAYRLASEAEWEYAARGGTDTTRYWGDAAEPACLQANIMTSATFAAIGSPASWTGKLICTATHSFTMPVGSFAPNPFGLNDMIGNIFEWVADCYHATYAGAPNDGSEWKESNCQQRIPRGGAFHSAPWLARAAFRGGPVPPDAHPVASGIRVARELF